MQKSVLLFHCQSLQNAAIVCLNGFPSIFLTNSSMYAAIFSIILLAVLFLNVLEKIENFLFKGNNQGYASE